MDLASIDHLLTTTRSVRKRLDPTRPVEPEIIERCIEIAFQAPTGSNRQNWHMLVVTDPAKRSALASLYRKAFEAYAFNPQLQPQFSQNDPRAEQMPRIRDSAIYLAEHLHEVPVMIVPCVSFRFENAPLASLASSFGSILPATWSLMLALRARGIGSAWTTLHLVFEREAAEVLGVPADVTQVALLPVAYFKGADFKPATRLPARERTYWNTWGATR